MEPTQINGLIPIQLSEDEIKNSPMEPTIDGNSISKAKDLIQIQVSEDEVKERISKFIERRYKQMNEVNVQEYCHHKLIDEDDPNYDLIDSCARVDAVYIPKFGSKMSKRKNRIDPQTDSSVKRIKTEPQEEYESNNNLNTEERFQPIESHLGDINIRTKDDCIIQCLKESEDKILFLESISPEYVQLKKLNGTSPKKKTDEEEKEKIYANLSMDEIRNRIQVIKESLKEKAKSLPKLNEKLQRAD